MASRKPLVIGPSGNIEQLQAGDNVEVGAAKQIFTATNTNAGAITLGQPVYISSADSVDKASASTGSTAAAIGLVMDASVASAAVAVIITDGVIDNSDWTAVIGSATLTAGAKYFLSTTAGLLTTIAPSATGEYITVVGTAISATSLEVSIRDSIKL